VARPAITLRSLADILSAMRDTHAGARAASHWRRRPAYEYGARDGGP
jgi:hypothetical protein